MADKPIIFSTPMVRALLEGRKAQTRRIIAPGNIYDDISSEALEDFELRGWDGFRRGDMMCAARIPYAPGDRLWVREAFQVVRETLDYETGGEWDCFDWPGTLASARKYLNGDARGGCSSCLFYRADGEDVNPSHFYPVMSIDGRKVLKPAELCWRPSIHMPRWASRLTLIVEAVKVERLQDISRGDAMLEGCPFPNMQQGPDPKDWFRELWNTINGPDAWDTNPWIYALTFRVVKGNIDQIGEASNG